VTPEIRDLMSSKCPACGGCKRPRHSFCRDCYSSLPSVLRAALYRRVGEGYEQAYLEAKRALALIGKLLSCPMCGAGKPPDLQICVECDTDNLPEGPNYEAIVQAEAELLESVRAGRIDPKVAKGAWRAFAAAFRRVSPREGRRRR